MRGSVLVKLHQQSLGIDLDQLLLLNLLVEVSPLRISIVRQCVTLGGYNVSLSEEIIHSFNFISQKTDQSSSPSPCVSSTARNIGSCHVATS